MLSCCCADECLAGTTDDYFNAHDEPIDALVSFDDVFEYIGEAAARRVFRERRNRGCSLIVITRESKQIGAGQHVDRGDGTMLLDFRLLTDGIYPPEKTTRAGYLIRSVSFDGC